MQTHVGTADINGLSPRSGTQPQSNCTTRHEHSKYVQHAKRNKQFARPTCTYKWLRDSMNNTRMNGDRNAKTQKKNDNNYVYRCYIRVHLGSGQPRGGTSCTPPRNKGPAGRARTHQPALRVRSLRRLQMPPSVSLPKARSAPTAEHCPWYGTSLSMLAGQSMQSDLFTSTASTASLTSTSSLIPVTAGLAARAPSSRTLQTQSVGYD